MAEASAATMGRETVTWLRPEVWTAPPESWERALLFEPSAVAGMAALTSAVVRALAELRSPEVPCKPDEVWTRVAVSKREAALTRAAVWAPAAA